MWHDDATMTIFFNLNNDLHYKAIVRKRTTTQQQQRYIFNSTKDLKK